MRRIYCCICRDKKVLQAISRFLAEPGKSSGPISWAMRLGVKAGGPKSDTGVEKEGLAQTGPGEDVTSGLSQGTNGFNRNLCPGTMYETCSTPFLQASQRVTEDLM